MLRGLLVLSALVIALLASPVYAIDPTQLPDEDRALLAPVHPQWPVIYPDLARSPLTPVHMRTSGLSLLGRLRAMLAEGQVTAETFSEWAAQHDVDAPTLVAALDEVPLWHPMDPVYLPICRALWDRLGDDLDAHLEFPYRARITMGIYLGVMEREEDAKKLFSSVPEEWQKQDPTVPMYHAANELVGFRLKAPRLGIWAWKWGSTMKGPADQAFVCFHIRQACEHLGDAEMVREELVPWAEEALARPGSEARWLYAVRELIWGYQRIGEMSKAADRGRYWISAARDRGVHAADLIVSRQILATVLDRLGAVAEAAEVLKEAIQSGPSDMLLVQMAQAQLLELQRDHPQIGKALMLPAKVKSVEPRELTLSVRLGHREERTIAVEGNATFRVADCAGTLPFVNPALGEGELTRFAVSRQTIMVAVQPRGGVGRQRGTIAIHTNDAASQTVDVALVVDVLDPIAAEPKSVFFGFVKAGDTVTKVVALTAAVPFEVKAVAQQEAPAVRSETARQQDGSWRVSVRLTAPGRAGVLEGNIELSTSLPDQPLITLPYYAHVTD